MNLTDARIRTADDLVAVIRARRIALGLNQLQVDDLAGLQGGYTGKIECGSKAFGAMSFTALLGALGLELRVDCTSSPVMHGTAVSQAQMHYELKKKWINRAAKGGRACWGESLPDERKKSMRKVWLARSKKCARARLEKLGGNVQPKNPME